MGSASDAGRHSRLSNPKSHESETGPIERLCAGGCLDRPPGGDAVRSLLGPSPSGAGTSTTTGFG